MTKTVRQMPDKNGTMTNIGGYMNKHESIPKRFLQEYDVQHDFFQSLVPDNLKNRIRAETVREEETNFIEDNLSQNFSDNLLSCQTVEGGDARIYFLIVHQDFDKSFIALRLLLYTMQILEREADKQSRKDKALPVVFPLVFYSDRTLLKTDIYELFQNPELARQYICQLFKVVQFNNYTRKELQQASKSIREMVAATSPKGGILTCALIWSTQFEIFHALQFKGSLVMEDYDIWERSNYEKLKMAEGEVKNLINLVQNTNMTLEQAAEMLESSDTVVQFAHLLQKYSTYYREAFLPRSNDAMAQ